MKVGYTGHLYDGRGIGVVLDIAEALAQVDVHLVGGTDADVDRWRGRAAARRLTNVHFHGYRPNAEMPRFLTSFDIVLAPYERRVTVAGGGGDTSRWMSPLKLFEYMAAGRPIVASRLEVLQEIIEDGTTAVLCSPDNPEEWIAAVRRLVDDAGERRRLGAAARVRLESEFSWESRARSVLASAARAIAPTSARSAEDDEVGAMRKSQQSTFHQPPDGQPIDAVRERRQDRPGHDIEPG